MILERAYLHFSKQKYENLTKSKFFLFSIILVTQTATTISTITTTTTTTITTVATVTTTTTTPIPEFLMNAGAESGTLYGWASTGSPMALLDNGTANLGNTPPYNGSYDFYGSPGRALHQQISLTYKFSNTELDSGLLYASISFWQRSANQTPPDTAGVTLNFLSATNTTLSSVSTGPQACVAIWCFVTGNWSLPIGTRSIDYIMEFDANYGSYADAWIDDNSLNIA